MEGFFKVIVFFYIIPSDLTTNIMYTIKNVVPIVFVIFPFFIKYTSAIVEISISGNSR